jgi:hypothetical protein
MRYVVIRAQMTIVCSGFFVLSASELPALPCGFAVRVCCEGFKLRLDHSLQTVQELDFGTSVGRGLIVVVLGMRDHF